MTDDASTRRTRVRLFAWGRNRDSSILIDTAFLIRSLRMRDSNASGTIIFVRPAGAASTETEQSPAGCRARRSIMVGQGTPAREIGRASGRERVVSGRVE